MLQFKNLWPNLVAVGSFLLSELKQSVSLCKLGLDLNDNKITDAGGPALPMLKPVTLVVTLT